MCNFYFGWSFFMASFLICTSWDIVSNVQNLLTVHRIGSGHQHLTLTGRLNTSGWYSLDVISSGLQFLCMSTYTPFNKWDNSPNARLIKLFTQKGVNSFIIMQDMSSWTFGLTCLEHSYIYYATLLVQINNTLLGTYNFYVSTDGATQCSLCCKVKAHPLNG